MTDIEILASLFYENSQSFVCDLCGSDHKENIYYNHKFARMESFDEVRVKNFVSSSYFFDLIQIDVTKFVKAVSPECFDGMVKKRQAMVLLSLGVLSEIVWWWNRSAEVGFYSQLAKIYHKESIFEIYETNLFDLLRNPEFKFAKFVLKYGYQLINLKYEFSNLFSFSDRMKIGEILFHLPIEKKLASIKKDVVRQYRRSATINNFDDGWIDGGWRSIDDEF